MLKRIANSILLTLLLAHAAHAQHAKHIILFIGDGMQYAAEIGTSRYLHGSNTRLAFQQLPYRTDAATWDVTTYNRYASALTKPDYSPAAFDPLIGYDPAKGGALPWPLVTPDDSYFLNKIKGAYPATDSASAATAWATGIKTDDGNLAWLPGDPEGGSVKTLAELLRQKLGYSIGVVSTVPFTHATPAAHASHNVSRNNYKAIADEMMLTIQPEVVIGGGWPYGGKFNYLSEDLYNQFRDGAVSGYVFAERAGNVTGRDTLYRAATMAAMQGKKLFGLFGGPDGNFESPIPADAPGSPEVAPATKENPLLRDTVEAALTVLSRDPQGFFVMIEQGDIDWAAHSNDYARIVGTVWDLDEGVKRAIDFVNRPGDSMDWTNTLLIVTSDHGNSYLRFSDAGRLAKGDLPRQDGKTYPDEEITFSSGSHTNELVRVYAGGNPAAHLAKYEGKWYPCTRIIDNTHIYHAILDAAGIPEKSPLTPVIPSVACK